MSTDRIKKYVLPYLPYVMMFWFFSKCGEAYRLAPGNDVLKKLVGCLAALGETFANPSPSFDLFDMCIGVVGAATVYGVVLYRKHHTKKWRKDVEYGSARWGTKKDIAPSHPVHL